MNREDVLHIINNNQLSPNVRLGQNFLVSEETTQKILESLDLKKEYNVLEIGPGLGALSPGIAAEVAHLDLIEIDSGLFGYLNKTLDVDNITIYHNDFLKINHEGEYDIIVSNLPYYCASEMLFIMATHYTASTIFVMVQREMAERIVSQPGTKEYGALTVNLNYYFEPRILFNVPRSAFFPRPDVASTFLQFTRKNSSLLSEEGTALFHRVVKSVFWGRRKKIVTALTNSPFLDFDRSRLEFVLSKTAIDPNTRGENLYLQNFIELSLELLKEN